MWIVAALSSQTQLYPALLPTPMWTPRLLSTEAIWPPCRPWSSYTSGPVCLLKTDLEKRTMEIHWAENYRILRPGAWRWRTGAGSRWAYEENMLGQVQRGSKDLSWFEAEMTAPEIFSCLLMLPRKQVGKSKFILLPNKQHWICYRLRRFPLRQHLKKKNHSGEKRPIFFKRRIPKTLSRYPRSEKWSLIHFLLNMG